jgi:hypothetical protein
MTRSSSATSKPPAVSPCAASPTAALPTATSKPPGALPTKPPPATLKSPPKSAFSSGKYKATLGHSGKKDVRNQMVIEALQEGIMSVYVKKFNVEEEAFLGPDLKLLQENAATMEMLGINAILYRKGVDGATAMMQAPSTNYPWRQFILIVGVEACKDPQERLKIADKLLAYFNANATTTMYKFPREMKLGEDKTQDPPRPVDAVLLNNDVIAMMKAAYPTLELQELAAYEETIVGSFWTDTEFGKKTMLSFSL